MKFETTGIEGLVILEPRRHADDRGHFSEVYNRRTLAELGLAPEFVQENQSLSRSAHTLRGLHYQRNPSAQTKLVRVVSGAILDVAVDVRPGSPTYGRHFGIELSDDNGRQLYIPKGFLHGFLTLEPDTEVVYLVDAHYDPAADGSIRYDDPTLNVDWRFEAYGVDPSAVGLSPKDRQAPLLAEVAPLF